MNGDSFSLKARRTTRIPLRIPIVLVYRGSEKERNLDAWTLIVNVNGARVECKHLFEQGQEVTLRVPHLAKSQKGTIVWRDTKANKNGGYECGIKLDKPENLWGVGFPPSDWTNRAAGIDELLPSKPEAAPEPASKSDPPRTEPAVAPVAAVEPEPQSTEQQEPVPVASPAEFPILVEEAGIVVDPISSVSQAVDLTTELNTPAEAPTATTDATELLLQKNTSEPARVEGSGLAENEPAQEAPDAQVIEHEPWRLEMAQESSSVQPLQMVQVREKPRASSAMPAAGTHTASDRLSTIFHELVESALEQRVQGLVEGLAARMERRIAELETAAMNQVEQQITNLIQSQSELLEGRALEVTSSHQAALEESVREYLAVQEEAAQRMQKEVIEETSRVICGEMSQTAAAGAQRMIEQAEEIVSATRTNLWQSVQQELPTLEQEVFTRARTKGEEAAGACFDELNRHLPERIGQAERSVNQQIDRVIEERMGQFDARLMERSEQLQAETKSRVEQQVQEVWKQTSQAFLRHIIGELNQKKQAWLEEVEGNLKEMSNQNLAWTQRRTTQILKNLGESLIETAGEVDCGLETPVMSPREDNEKQETNQLVEAHSGD